MFKNQTGYIALSTVIVILVVIIAISLTVAFSSISEAQSGLALFKGESSLNFVEGCAEDVMLKIRTDGTYAVTSFTRPEGTCSITYNAGTTRPTTWDITVTTADTAYKRSIRTIFTRNAVTGLTLTSWNEL